ncbi:MAG: hypothetical protein AB1351_03875 [Thermoproteota archaeon]
MAGSVAFAVAIGIIYIVPLVFSSQPEEELISQPASITEIDPTANDTSGQQQEQSDMQTEQQNANNNDNDSSIAEGSPSGVAESAIPRPQ